MAGTRSAAPARRPNRKTSGGRAPSTRAGSTRYAVVYDTKGPKVRMGVLWFLGALAAAAIGPLPVALVYGGTAAVAAAQTARCWRRRNERPSDTVAATMAGAMGLGACLGAGGAGIALLAGVVGAYMVATSDTSSPHAAITDAGSTIRCALPPGIVAMSMVLLARLDQGSAIGLLLLVSAYETGDYLVGSGARNPYEGPAAGGAAAVVITFILSTLPISALDFGEAWLFGGVVLLLAPLGQLAANAILPSPKAPASALRRLDSLLLAAPLWCWGVGLLI